MERWIISEKQLNLKRMNKWESILCQGNGYMGIRNSFEECYIGEKRAALINGVFNTPCGEVSEIANLPDVINFEIKINGEKVNMLCGEIEDYQRILNMKNGESRRSFTWTGKNGSRARIIFRRFISDVKKHIVAQKISIEPFCESDIEILSGIDAKVTDSGVQHFGALTKRAYSDGSIGLFTETTSTKIPIAVYSLLKSSEETQRRVEVDRRSVFVQINFKTNETVEFEKLSSYVTMRDCEYIDRDITKEEMLEDGKDYLSKAQALGYDGLFEENCRSWAEFWNKHYIRIEEDEFHSRALNFANYHLKIMANEADNRVGIGAKGLSGTGYKGHSFWDTEMFILPYYIFNQPQKARNLLEYRYKLLKSACEKAKKNGYEGAMYPWESAWIDDGETCPEYGDMDLESGELRKNNMGDTEVHINADIAYGIWQYYLATGDWDFMDKYGCEMIILTAVFWASRVSKSERGYDILNVIGPDEYKEGVDNNAYTNYMAYFNMKLALKVLGMLSEKSYKRLDRRYCLENAAKIIEEVCYKLYLPKADGDGRIEQFEGFLTLKELDISEYKKSEKVCEIFYDYSFEDILKMKIAKQADIVMLFYTLEDFFLNEQIKKNFEYYEKRTLHDSSLSMCIHSLVASRAGMSEMAEKLFNDCCLVDLGDKTNNSSEGIHAASIGGVWLALVMGFAGMRVSETSLSFSPVLPSKWKEYEFPLVYKGNRLLIKVNKEGCNIRRLDGEEVKIEINGESRII